MADIGGAVDDDDIFLVCQYIDGEVITHTYSMASDTQDASGRPLAAGATKLTSSSGTAPVNKLTKPRRRVRFPYPAPLISCKIA